MPELAQDYVDHPMLEDEVVERRMYQLQLSGAALERSSLVVLPTGTGKTTVSLLVTAARLAGEPDATALFLAPTKPLVEQHASFYREALAIPDEAVGVFTGEVRPDDREALWSDLRVVIATPQVVENDLMGGRIALDDVTHLTFDECHRSVGGYAYNYIADRYWQQADDPLVTGLTASPGSDKEAVLQVCENLGIDNVEILTEDDPLLAEHTHETDVDWTTVEVPDDLVEVRDLLQDVMVDRMEELKEMGVLRSARPDVGIDTLLAARGELQELIDADDGDGYRGMSLHAEVMKLRHAVEIVETQDVATLERYFEKMENEARTSGGSKAVKRMMKETKVRKARRKAEQYDDLHPKKDVMRSMVIDALSGGDGDATGDVAGPDGEPAEATDSRVIVFTEYRDTASTLVDFLEAHDGVRPVRFVGQASKDGDDGLTQTQQQEILEQFRGGAYNVLVATSVAEEGLDVPEVDLVLFYEPVPSEIRAIQRRGRTGRQRAGQVKVLMAEDTRDEAYYWSAKRKEDEMKQDIRELKGDEDAINEEIGDEAQRGLDEFDASDGGSGDGDDEVTITVDQRETKGSVARSLDDRGDVQLRLETLDVGDFVLSDRVAVERKSVDDFVDTLTGDRDLFAQAGDLRSNYPRGVVVIEGDHERLYAGGIHENAVRGALASLAVDFGIPLLVTADQDETAKLLYTIAQREQRDEDREHRVHGEKASATLDEQQEYVVASVAEVGPVTARALLDEFGSVEAVFTASEEELTAADGVGPTTAERIREVVGSPYATDDAGGSDEDGGEGVSATGAAADGGGDG